MDLQPCRAGLALFAAALIVGCQADPPPKPPAFYTIVAAGASESHVRLVRSDHYLLYTTLQEDARLAPIVATLEAAWATCIRITGVQPAADALPESVFLFEHRDEWEAFTRSRTGADASLYLKIDRGGYTLGKASVVRDLGEHDTLRVLAHESMHLFIASHFVSRPPPFLEEGLATLLEDVDVREGVAKITVGRSAPRADRLGAMTQSHALLPLSDLLGMHAGDVVGLSPQVVEGFYAQAWAFARFLGEADNGRYGPMLLRLLADAANGTLGSRVEPSNRAVIERYFRSTSADLEPRYRRFAERLTP